MTSIASSPTAPSFIIAGPKFPPGRILPIRLFRYYGNQLALWFYCRWVDEVGSGRAIFDINDAAAELEVSKSTIRKWLCWGKRHEMWRHYQSAKDIVSIYYTSSHRLAARVGLNNFGPVLEIEDIASVANHRLPMLATDAEISDLQTQSRFAAHCEQIARTMVRVKTHRFNDGAKFARKPLQPWKLFNHPATNLARVLWQAGVKLGVSEGFVAYGASQTSVADRRGLSLRTVNRHLSNQYRVSKSPVRGFRGFIPCERFQINRRLNRKDGERLDRAAKVPLKFAPPELQSGKCWRNNEGRWFERLPCIYEEMPGGCHLRKVKFRRSRLSGPTERHKQSLKDYWIDKNNLLEVFQRPGNFSY